MHKHGKTDLNHQSIVATFHAAGADVQSLADVGGGCPDLLVAYCGRWHVVEIKTERRTLNELQMRWHERFGCTAPIYIVRTPDEAITLLQELARAEQ